MRITRIFLVRHGEINNPDNILYGSNIDLHLNKNGEEQIRNTANKIKNKGFNIEKIYTSPLSRALKSSEIIAKVFNLKDQIIVEEDLKDSHIKALAGKPNSIRKELHTSGKDEYEGELVKLGNESREQIITRMKKAFYKIVKENEGRTLAIVSHGDPLRFLLFAIEYPGKKIPGMNILVKDNYPLKGSAVEVVIDENNKLLQKTFY